MGSLSVRNALHRRAVLDQAKGLIMGVHRCDADEAWFILTGAAGQHGVDVRVIADGLIELASNRDTSPSVHRDPAVTSVLLAALQESEGVDHGLCGGRHER